MTNSDTRAMSLATSSFPETKLFFIKNSRYSMFLCSLTLIILSRIFPMFSIREIGLQLFGFVETLSSFGISTLIASFKDIWYVS